MDINRITVHLRPRNQWEAIDMGMVVARRWFFRLWLTWLVSSLPLLPVWLTLAFLLPGNVPFLFIIFFWLFKPLYEPPLLHWLSRILFDEKLTTKQVVREIRAATSFKRVLAVCGTRTTPLRSFTMPILLLEGLTGKLKRRRSSVLCRGYETALLLTLACFIIELILCLSLSSTLYWMIPEQLRWLDFGQFIFMGDTWFTIALYILSCSFIAPFYVSSGFFLYISRRVELEAWDLELGFKQINRQIEVRSKKTTSLVAAVFLSTTLSFCPPGGPAAVQAEETFSPQKAKKIITEVLDEREFGEKKKVQRWVPKNKEEKKRDTDWLELLRPIFEKLSKMTEKVAEFLGEGSRYIVWTVAGAFIAFLLLRYRRIRTWISRYLPDNRQSYTPPAQLFGMDIRPDSLPGDIGHKCRELLEADRKREVLSLLYRSVLSRLVNRQRLFIPESLTENECCVLVEARRPKKEALFFRDLTALWLTTAYGHMIPSTRSCCTLIDTWQTLYGETV